MPDARRSIVVVGAGAAGLVAAIHAAEAGARVVVAERTRQGGKKIVVSGGGRCNVLPSVLDPGRYVTASSPNTLRKMLLAWPLAEQRRWFEGLLGGPLVLEPETGKLFPPTDRATDVRDALVTRARRAGAAFRFDTRVVGLRADPSGGWTVRLDGGEVLAADAVVLATGGLSVPATGSDGDGLRFTAALGHTLHPTYPALTPLTAAPAPHADLAGVSLTARVEGADGKRPFAASGGFLFTHRGYSGPAVLDASHLVTRARQDGQAVPALHVRWVPDLDATAWADRLAATRGPAAGALRRALPVRLADALLAAAGVPPDRPGTQLRRAEREALLAALTRYPLPVTGDEGYKKAEVTGGGVALGEVDARTLESRRAPGLYLCGEVLDAFGPIGGYNFAWAWSTGRAAGLAAAG